MSRTKKSKKKHKRCAGSGCRNIVAKDSKKGALCSICAEKLGVDSVKVGEPAAKKVEAQPTSEPSISSKLESLRKTMNGG